MNRQLLFFCALLIACSPEKTELSLSQSPHDLHFNQIPTSWDEGIPLGNGMLGALIWEKEGRLRLSLDRADLWDLRPMENVNTAEFSYQWVVEQWKTNDYKPVQDLFDAPYDRNPAPSKIPGAALEFDISLLGEVEYVHLYVNEALCEVKWQNGALFQAFVHATEPLGWYQFEGLTEEIRPRLIPPAYTLEGVNEEESPVTGQDLRRLGYPAGALEYSGANTTYEQEGWNGFQYQVSVSQDNDGVGRWSISSNNKGQESELDAKETVLRNTDISPSRASHISWWSQFWEKSAIDLPDEILEKQWYLEQYKFGAAARTGAPPISLQAVWTADNGKLPPWKGDFHHDLNTQLSYWASYSSNHLEGEEGFLTWLWENKGTFENYTKAYYEVDGLNVPGVSTLAGQPMGGWIQYSFGPTVSAWLSQHFYLHWRYSMDQEFLRERAYPWIKEVATFLENISIKDENGQRKLPISSSPELHDNSREAWFEQTTNFDLALIRWTFQTAAELAEDLAIPEEASKWTQLLHEWPALAVDDQTGLMVSPNLEYERSHRHFSHLMAYHPLGLIDYSNGKDHIDVIDHTLSNLDVQGTDWWVGYSFAWLGNLRARAFDGEGAADALKKFATSFCLPNSFHVNGDQSGQGYSKFTYRPFTLEGNFAFAAGIQEMLIQSHSGVVHLFPAIPNRWMDLSFSQLRTEGAFLISAKMKAGEVTHVAIESTAKGTIRLNNPFNGTEFSSTADYEIIGDILEIEMKGNEYVRLVLSK